MHAFKAAIERKPNSEPYRREKEAMSVPHDQHQPHEQQQQQAADVAGIVKPQAWCAANSVEPDSQDDQQHQQRYNSKQHAMVLVADDLAASAEVKREAGGGGGGSGAAIPISPPSSPTHVAPTRLPAAAEAQEVVAAVVEAPKPETAAAAAAAQALPSPPAPGLPASAVAEGVGGPVSSSGPPAAAVPVRLGRGRKLCPSCKALTKSAVKQCRLCHHVFNPVSRMRAQHREPKENEDAPVLPRRRHRPSQRLLESRVVSAAAGPQEAAPTGGEAAVGRAASGRRPLAAFMGGGDTNQRVASGAMAATPVATNKTGAVSASGEQAPKRSHKRKVPLPPGVVPPKRKKGAAAAARLAAAEKAAEKAATAPAAASEVTGPHGILPRLSLPERQRVAEDLVASPAPSHVLVPESPELAPTATPAGPLLFIAPPPASPSSNSPSSLEDDPEWLPHSGVIVSPAAAFVQQHQERQQEQLQRWQNQQNQLYLAGAATSLTGLLLGDNQEEEEEAELALPVRRHESGGGEIDLDLSADCQDRDPFAGVEITWLENGGGGEAAVGNPTAAGGGGGGGAPTVFPLVSRDGTTMEQHRSVFPSAQSTELLGDADDALMWNPLRTPSVGADANGGGGGVGAAAVTATATVAGRSLTLWPGSSVSDCTLLTAEAPAAAAAAAAAASSCYSRSTSSGRSPSPGNLAFPNFERGAAIASSAAGGSGGSGGSASHAVSSPEYLLAEASCSSLPDPLVIGGRDGTSAAVAAVSMDSGDGDGGGFWHPFQHGNGGSGGDGRSSGGGGGGGGFSSSPLHPPTMT
ncbi:unnamed protein product [Ectocarpus sp. CCAP 1310/34]|nr:unnamed protein product [Ectocarpus sp. CCAP 1310/34]